MEHEEDLFNNNISSWHDIASVYRSTWYP